MARNRQEGSPVESNVFSDNKYMTASAAITALFTIPAGAPTVWYISAAAPQTVRLPVLADGAHYVISALTSTLTMNDSTGAALSPAATIATGKTSAFYAVKIPATGVLTWVTQAGA